MVYSIGMDFLKILLSTLIIALITALVFIGLYFLFPSVAESQFGVSVNYAPERIPPVSMNERLAAERAEAEAAEAENAVRAVPGTEAVPPMHAEPVTEVTAAVPGAGPAAEETTDVMTESAEPPRTEPETAEKPAEKTETAPLPELNEGGLKVKKFMESAKVQIVLSFLPDSVDASAVKNPDEWNAHDIEQINKIGAYIEEHGIDLYDSIRLGNITKILNTKKLPDDLAGLLDFIQREVEF